MKTFIIVRLTVEAIHNWPDAKTIEPAVAYLSHLHRHQFHIEAIKEVSHDDRDIEIIKFKQELQDYFKRNYFDTMLQLCNLGSRSCEMIAADLILAYDLKQCKVLEDNENGAIVCK